MTTASTPNPPPVGWKQPRKKLKHSLPKTLASMTMTINKEVNTERSIELMQSPHSSIKIFPTFQMMQTVLTPSTAEYNHLPRSYLPNWTTCCQIPVSVATQYNTVESAAYGGKSYWESRINWLHGLNDSSFARDLIPSSIINFEP